MNALSPHVIYGTPPRPLVEWPAHAMQCSPRIVNASVIEAWAPGSIASALVHAPASTVERRYVMAHVLQALETDAPLTVVALKDKGGNRIADELQQFGCTVTQTSRSHYRLCHATRPAKLTAIDDALTQGAMRLDAELELWTQPGIFSWNRVDAGTAFLLEHLPHFSGNGADLGCGLGLLSRAVLASPKVTRLLLTDVDRRAVDASRRNVPDARAEYVWADVRHNALPVSGLDFVVMNPPFHDDGMEDKSLGQCFIERAATLLKKGGVCWLVANRHLPYEALLANVFSSVRLVAERDGFKIYAAEK